MQLTGSHNKWGKWATKPCKPDPNLCNLPLHHASWHLCLFQSHIPYLLLSILWPKDLLSVVFFCKKVSLESTMAGTPGGGQSLRWLRPHPGRLAPGSEDWQPAKVVDKRTTLGTRICLIQMNVLGTFVALQGARVNLINHRWAGDAQGLL